MVVVIDPQIAGISGDMILCSLVDLGASKDKIIKGVKQSEKFLSNSIIKQIDFRKMEKHGIESTEMFLDIDESVHERKGIEIKKAIVNLTREIGLSDKAKVFAESCINTLIASESHIHGLPIDSVHFHEASSIDTLIDIVGTAIALDDLRMFDEEIICMSVAVGGGNVTFSHGTMSNPASAILEIFKNSKLSIHGSKIKEELTTPTGASILVNLSKTSMEYYPSMQIKSIGYGAGKKNFEGFSNVLKIVKGVQKNNFEVDAVKILETNVDDVSGEVMGNLIEKIMNKGAKDVSIYHGITKKGRPTNLISVICDDMCMHDIMDILVIETGTLGIRVTTSNRFIVPRMNHNVKLILDGKEFVVKYKVSSFKGKNNFKIEFDDLKYISNTLNKSIKETESLVRIEIMKLGVNYDKT
ncbi:MAG: nickel pincer cofactor biosynthesis protein LarC [Nitrosarchaeum sp.]